MNQLTESNQIKSDVAMDSDGDFIITWTNYENTYIEDTLNGGVYVRRYNKEGAPKDTTEFLVNTYTTGYQWVPQVAMDNEGDFVVTWSSEQDGGTNGDEFYSIYARRYRANGRAVDREEFQINTIHTTEKQAKPEIAMNSVGHFMITWWSEHDGSNAKIMAGNGLNE